MKDDGLDSIRKLSYIHRGRLFMRERDEWQRGRSHWERKLNERLFYFCCLPFSCPVITNCFYLHFSKISLLPFILQSLFFISKVSLYKDWKKPSFAASYNTTPYRTNCIITKGVAYNLWLTSLINGVECHFARREQQHLSFRFLVTQTWLTGGGRRGSGRMSIRAVTHTSRLQE